MVLEKQWGSRMKTFSFNTNSCFFPLSFCFSFYCCTTISGPSLKETAPKSSNHILRETFDNSILKDNFFVIQPTFSRNEIPLEKPITERSKVTNKQKAPLQIMDTSIKEKSSVTQKKQQVFRVQLLALSNGKNSRKRYRKLTEQLSEPVYIQKRGNLFLISAGDFSERDSAIAFKNYVIKLNEDYSDAFVISVQKPMTNDLKKDDHSPRISNNVEQFSTFGWRVLLDQSLVQKQANTVKEEAVIQLRRQDIDVIFKAPWYKVEVGHYTTENAVQIATEKIQRIYPNAIKVRSQIIATDSNN